VVSYFYFTSVLFYGLQNLSAPRLRIYTLKDLNLKKNVKLQQAGDRNFLHIPKH